jgi:hypothetical protein
MTNDDRRRQRMKKDFARRPYVCKSISQQIISILDFDKQFNNLKPVTYAKTRYKN